MVINGRRLGRKLALTTLVLALLAGAVASVEQLPPLLVEWMLQADTRVRAATWQRRLLGSLAGGSESFAAGRITPGDDQFLSHITHVSDIYRFKLFDARGQVFWSSRGAEVGSRTTERYFTDVVARGRSFYKRESVPIGQIDEMAPAMAGGEASQRSVEIVEIYTPIMHRGRFAGAIEFYSDVTAIRAAYGDRMRAAVIGAVVVGIVVFATVIGLTFRLGRLREAQLRHLADTEREMMAQQMRLSREVRLLGEFNEWLQSSTSLDELFGMVARFMSHLLPNSEGSVYVFSSDREVLEGVVSWNGGKHLDHIHPRSCWSLRRGRTYAYGLNDVEFACEHTEPHDARPYFCFPVVAHGETIGLMHLKARRDTPLKSFLESRKLSQMCAEQISMAIANARLRDILHDQSMRDPLTGLRNRRYLNDNLKKGIESHSKRNSVFSFVVIDIDYFKRFNDEYGHDAGDVVLRAVSGEMEKACTPDDVACRYGGEEFVLVLAGVDSVVAARRAQALNHAVERLCLRHGDVTLPAVSISAGVAMFPDHGCEPQSLLQAADLALYAAKAAGRNRIVVAGAATPVVPSPDEAGDPASVPVLMAAE